MATETLIVTEDGMTMDALLWRRFGRQSNSGRVDSAYAAQAQQDLAEFGPILPVGTRVIVELPTVAPLGVKEPVRIIRLWSE